MRKTFFAFSFVLAFNLSFAQSWQDTVNKIESLINRYYSADAPGMQLSISRNGQTIFSKAWGMADLEHKVSLTTGSILEAGSVSKQFTAAAILLLEQQGKLSINDDVRKYIPELPDYGYTIYSFGICCIIQAGCETGEVLRVLLAGDEERSFTATTMHLKSLPARSG